MKRKREKEGTERKKSKENEREKKRSRSLMYLYILARSRLRETRAFPSRPGIDARRETPKGTRRVSDTSPWTSYDRIVNYNLFSLCQACEHLCLYQRSRKIRDGNRRAAAARLFNDLVPRLFSFRSFTGTSLGSGFQVPRPSVRDFGPKFARHRHTFRDRGP